MMPLHMPNTLQDYARLGAAARLTEIQSEVASIRAAFPELDGRAPVRRTPGRRGRRAATPAQKAPFAPAQPGVPKRSKMSAKARKAISDAQKKRWAAYNAQKKDSKHPTRTSHPS
jgi:hypothetical protein